MSSAQNTAAGGADQPSSSSSINSLRTPTTYITTHSTKDGTAIVHSAAPANWQAIGGVNYFNVVYSTSSFPVSMDNEADLRTHEQVMSTGSLGLVQPHGTVCRLVDFKPGGDPLMHRTQSLDYGIVVEGEIEMHLDSGEVRTLRRGDVAVQRGTMHAWRNASETEWARMVFVLQDCRPLTVGGQVLKEDLGHAAGLIPGSGNDQ